ncbi:unnamed protein product [Paramecium sonneborni]|uniref:Uncharacterized protein n=1 Tax=Paramecium sonneborni TaxID=65129 RepID=A0A8S1LGG1_9CILI|nr:unnamed protein product [Paramecium sonneborni]
MDQNNGNLGLLSNKSNSKYKESKKINNDFLFQDNGDDQEYVSLDDAKVQHAEVVKPKQLEEPIAHAQYNVYVNQIIQNNQQKQQIQQQNQQAAQQQVMQPQIQEQQKKPIQQQNNQYINNPYINQYSNLSMDQILNSFSSTSINYNNNNEITQSNRQTYQICIHCKTPQTILNEKQPFRCCQCKQVNQPNYGYFQCGTCKMVVMYQCELSNIIKCTKCNTMNYVQQPNLPNTLQQYQLQQQQQQQQQNIPQQQSQVYNQNLQQSNGLQQKNYSLNPYVRNKIDPMYQKN